MQNIVSIKKELYTVWANKVVGRELFHDLYYDIADGSKLIYLIEAIWNEPIGTDWVKDTTKHKEKLDNFSKGLYYLEKKGIKLNIRESELVYDKSGKTALPLLDALYFNHSINKIAYGQEKGVKALLNWCNDAAMKKNVQFNDFRYGWWKIDIISTIIEYYMPNVMSVEMNDKISRIKNLANIKHDDSINFYIVSQLFYIFSDTQQILDSQPIQEMKKEPPQKNENHINDNQNQQNLQNEQTNKKNIEKEQPPPSKEQTNKKNIEKEQPPPSKEQTNNVNKQIPNRRKPKVKINTKMNTPEFINPNFEEGAIPKDELAKLMEKKDYLPHFINNRYSTVCSSRYPIQVACISNNKVEFKKNEFKNVLFRAGSRPIIFVPILGSFQQGKSSTLGGLTGNYGYATGNSMKDSTKGVYIDGPYDIDYLYNRFNYKISKDNFYLKVDELKPVIFFFDIEGYGSLMHGEKDDKNKDLFIQLCTPFMCISSCFIYLAPAAPQVHEIQTIVDALKISTLTSIPKDNQEDTNGELKMIIAIKSFKILETREDPYTKKEIEEKINDQLIREIKNKIKNEWQGNNKLEKCGIHAVFSPLIDKENVPGYNKTFGYFAKDVISGIELASQGHFMRGSQSTIELFEFIISNYKNGKFNEIIKERISEEYKNTLGRVALSSLFVVRDDVLHKLDEEYANMGKNLNKKRKSLNDIKNEYFEYGQQIMEKKLEGIGNSDEAHRYYQLLFYFISEMIDEKEVNFRKMHNNHKMNYIDKTKALAIELYNECMESMGGDMLKTLRENKYFNFNKDLTVEFITKEASAFQEKLRELKIEKNLLYLSQTYFSQLCEDFKYEIINKILVEFDKDNQIYIIELQKNMERIQQENIQKQKDLEEKKRLQEEENRRKKQEEEENRRREEENRRKQREAQIKIENSRAKMIIKDNINNQLLVEFTNCEKDAIDDITEILKEKDKYIETYLIINKVIENTKDTIVNGLFEKAGELLDKCIKELNDKKNPNLNAIMRVYNEEKNALITKDLVQDFVEKNVQTIEDDINAAYSTARILLTTYAYEQKRERTDDKKFYAVKFRKITIYPEGTEVSGEWKIAHLEKLSILKRIYNSIFKFKEPTAHIQKITQYEYSKLLQMTES